jgi:hypothetical protein
MTCIASFGRFVPAAKEAVEKIYISVMEAGKN